MKSKNKIKLRRISLLISLGILLTTQNLGATSYSQTLTGDLATDTAEGHDYSVIETVPGHLTYNFLPNDKIHILGDHSVWIPETTNFEEYYGVKIEAENSNNLNLTSLKNISIDISGGTETTISEGQFIGSNLEAVGVRDDGKGDISFGDDTQININNTSGDWAVGTGSGVDLTTSFIGISQEGSGGTSSQSFGDRTQITLDDIGGKVSMDGGGSGMSLTSSLTGISQSVSNGVDTSQVFGDDSRITLTSSRGDISGEGFFSSRSQYTGIDQEGGDNGSSSQSFGDRTQIVLNDILGETNFAGEEYGVDLNSSLVGIRQSSDLAGTSNQIFGDDSQIRLTRSNGTVSGKTNFTSNSEYVGIEQNGNGTTNQSFGDRTQIDLNDLSGEINFSGEYNHGELNSNLVGIRESVGVSGTSNQIFGDDSQIRLTSTSGTVRGEGYFNAQSYHTGIEQDSNGKGKQSFGNRTQVVLEDTLGEVSQSGIMSYSNRYSVLRGIKQSSNTTADNSQIFGDSSQIILTNRSSDISGVKSFTSHSDYTGIGQDSSISISSRLGETSDCSNLQKFGDDTQIYLSITTGNQTLNEESSSSTITSMATGISQTSGYNWYHTSDMSAINHLVANQTFGDRTQIILNTTTKNKTLGVSSSAMENLILSGVTQENSQMLWGQNTSAIYRNNSSSQSFGDDTQIILSSDHEDVAVGEGGSVTLYSTLTGVSQNSYEGAGTDGNGSQSSTSSTTQLFGENTQIVLSNTNGDFILGDRSYGNIRSTLLGVNQHVDLGSEYRGSVNHLDSSNSQIFGDNTEIRLSNNLGNMIVGDEGYGSLSAEFTGINQNISLRNAFIDGTNEFSVNNSQIFGDNTRIIMDNHIGSQTTTGYGSFASSLQFVGISQYNNLKSFSSGGSNDITINNSQIFGNDTQISMTNTKEDMDFGSEGSQNQELIMAGIEQYSFSELLGDPINYTSSQTFGDNTRIVLNSTTADQSGEGGELQSTSRFMGIRQANSDLNQTFGANTQVLINNTAGTITMDGEDTRVVAGSSLIGIAQINSKNSTQTFGDNTKVQVKNSLGDLIVEGDESQLGLISEATGISQSGSSGSSSQTFGENTQIRVESKAGSIKNTASAEIDFSAKGIEQANRGAQMTFGNGTQVTVHAEVGAIEGVQELNSSVNAYGIYSVGSLEDDLVFDGDLSIQATVKPLIRDGVVLTDQANAYSLFATGNGAIRLNDQGANKITLVGDLGTGASGLDNRVTVDLANSASYLQGTVKANEGSIFLTLAEGATWRPQGDGNIDATFGESTGQLDLKSGGVVDLAWWNNQNSRLNPINQFRTLTIDRATLEDGGIFRVNSDVLHGQADRINIVDASGGGTQYIQVAYDPSMTEASGILSALPGNEPIVLDIQGGTALDRVVGKMYQSDSPLHQYEIDPTIVSDGHQIRIGSLRYSRTENLSETPYTVVDAQAAFRNLWKLEGNNVLRRMGDLRLAPEENTSGAWARVYGGKLTSDSSYQRTFEQKYTGMQVGYDREHLLHNGKLHTGVMFNYLDSSPSYSSGSGSLYSKGLGAYGSWIGNNNHHVDLVLRASRLNNEYHLVDNSGNFASGSYDAWAYGMSAEYGYRAQLKKQFFLEPQVELSFGHIGSADHKTDSGLSVQQSSINTAQSRIGLLIGKDFGSKNQMGNAYFRGSWVHDFSSNGTLDGFYQGDRARLKTADHQGSHLELNLGANLKVNQKLDTYLELTKTFGGKVDTDWQVNGGVRLMW